MDRSRRRLLVPVGTAVTALAVSLSSSGVAAAHDDGGHGSQVLRSGLVGSSPTGPTLFDVRPGGAPWVVDRQSSVKVKRDGTVDIKIRGLVIPPPQGDGTNPAAVATVSATVVCDGGRVTTPTAPIDRAGDARIRADVALPSPCSAPTVLIHPNGATARYIAVSD